MNTINLEDFDPSMGQLISLVDEEDYVPYKGSINLNIDKLLSNPKKYLDKDKTYFITCLKGVRSRRAVQILSVYGYKVIRAKA